jgi:hypothetical protein
MSSNRTRQLIYLLEEMLEKELELESGIEAWNKDSGDPDYDPCSMASCDPSDQYILSEEIDEIWQQVVDKVTNP